MIKIVITGSISSGKTTASKILSLRKGPLFSADKIVQKLYTNKVFKKIISKSFKIANQKNIKKVIKNRILSKKSEIKKLEKIIHPIVRKEMFKFIKKNKRKKIIFLEIPLLIESKLMKYFDVILFIKAKRSLRLERFKAKNGDKRFFTLLDKKQMNESKKKKYCNHVIINEKNLKIFKKKLLKILSLYE